MANVSERTLQLSVLVAFASGVLVGWQANRLRRRYLDWRKKRLQDKLAATQKKLDLAWDPRAVGPRRPPRGHLASPARSSSRSQARLTLSARSAGLLPESVSSTYSGALRGDFADGRISWDRRVFGEPTGGDLYPQAPERGGSFVFPNNKHFGIVVQFTACV